MYLWKSESANPRQDSERYLSMYIILNFCLFVCNHCVVGTPYEERASHRVNKGGPCVLATCAKSLVICEF